MDCHGLKMQAPNSKMRLTDVADKEQLLGKKNISL
jgi:hypothetical protein